MHLPAVDLNLLVALDALLAEQHVTRAAERVGLTQPAMSHALARLRTLLDDPILVRTPDGMSPTARARSLVGPVRQAIESVKRALEPPRPFVPAEAEGTFVWSFPDIGQFLVLPPVIRRLKKEAPRINIEVNPRYGGIDVRALESGKVDLLSTPAGEFPDGVHFRKVKEMDFVCIARRDHPEIGKRLTLKKFASIPHAMVGLPGVSASQPDEPLAALGYTRRVALRVPSFLVIPAVVGQSDLIALCPRELAERFRSHYGLTLHTPPVEIPPARIHLVWHERTAHDPAQQWIRQVFIEEAAKI